jgi:cardiolipin synthase
VAGLSDAVDGALAKRFRSVAPIGAYLDPLADKALLVAVTLALATVDALPMWLVTLIVSRDVLIVGGALLYNALTNGLRMQPLAISKLNTLAQIVLVGVVLAELGLGRPVPTVSQALVWAVAASTVASGAAYVWTWSRYALEWQGNGK